MVEESGSADTRRIEALTGPRARTHRVRTQELLAKVVGVLGCEQTEALASADQLMTEVRQLKKEITSGKATEHADKFAFNGEGPRTDLEDYNSVRDAVRNITRRLNVSIDDVTKRLESLLGDRTKQIAELKEVTAGGQLSADDLMANGETIGGALMILSLIHISEPTRPY